MCSRFSDAEGERTIKTRFGPTKTFSFRPRFNIAPTQKVPVLRLENGELIEEDRAWGLYPKWAKERKQPIINARAETIAEKPMFSKLIKTKRCLVPADGYFEWETTSQGKTPWRFILKGGKPFCIAGIYDEWIDHAAARKVTTDFPDEAPASATYKTFAMLTVEGNSLTRRVHDRMPLILHEEHYDWWLDDDPANAIPTGIMKPFPAEWMDCYRVSPTMSNWRVEGPEAIKPVQS
jgi:putative SOS response-associated peptidase YedK